jgi:hypothetical protein
LQKEIYASQKATPKPDLYYRTGWCRSGQARQHGKARVIWEGGNVHFTKPFLVLFVAMTKSKMPATGQSFTSANSETGTSLILFRLSKAE